MGCAVLETLVRVADRADRSIAISGKKLAAARRAAGLTQEQLAQRVGRTTSREYKVERDEVSYVFLTVVSRYAEALGLSRDEFLSQVRVEDDTNSAEPTSEICFTPAPADHAQLLQLAEADEKTPADMVNELVAEALKRRAEIAGSINPHVPLNGKPWGRSHAAKRPAPKGNGKRKN